MGPILVMPMLKAVKNGVKINHFKKKKTLPDILENGTLAGGGVLFFEMPQGFFHSISVPPNTLQILSEVFML
jgi:hypothetical protein